MKDNQAFAAAVLRLQGTPYEEIARLLGITREEAVEKAHRAVQAAQFEEPPARETSDHKVEQDGRGFCKTCGKAVIADENWISKGPQELLDWKHVYPEKTNG